MPCFYFAILSSLIHIKIKNFQEDIVWEQVECHSAYKRVSRSLLQSVAQKTYVGSFETSHVHAMPGQRQGASVMERIDNGHAFEQDYWKLCQLLQSGE
jgi:hypothetical protein